ncbi:hypothetical protein [Pseudomonas capeferrum]
MRTIVDLKFSFAVSGRPQSEEPSQCYTGVDVSIDEVQHGRDTQLIIALHEPLEGLAELNHVWITVNGKVREGQGRYDAGRRSLVVTLYQHQAE